MMKNKLIKSFFLLVVIIVQVQLIHAQKINNINIDSSYNGTALTAMLKDIEVRYDIDIIYNKNTIEGYTVTGIKTQYNLIEFLEDLVPGYAAVKANEKVLFIVKDRYVTAADNLKHNYRVLKKNDNNLLSGEVLDAENNEPIIGASVYVPESGVGNVTNINGEFSFNLSKKVVLVQIKYIGYATKSILVGFSKEIGSSNKLNELLFESYTQLESINITAEREESNVKQQVTGIERLGIESIKQQPTFLGEVDPLKSMTTLPGVSTSGDLTAGINVRGGTTGQNYIYQDGAIIYNPTHLFGFFSAFNPDLVDDFTLYKGGGTANFGGRISSILDIGLRNGNKEKFKVNGGIGMISSRLSVEGPISKNKSSFILGGRVSYSDWLIKAVDHIQIENSSAQFYDLTGKYFQKINENDFLTLSGYLSHDDFNLSADSTFIWGTQNLSLRWDHNYSEKSFSKLTLSSSNYSSGVVNNDELSKSKYDNGINTLITKYSHSLNQTSKYKFEIGIEATYHKLIPGKLEPLNEISSSEKVKLSNQNVLEPSLYLQSQLELGEKLGITAGVRYSTYFRFGKDVQYEFNRNIIEGRTPLVTDTSYFQNGQLMSFYNGLEPRVSIRFLLNNNTSLKSGYYRTYQYLHLISNTTVPMPQDYWLSSSRNLSPEIGDQISLGLFTNIGVHKYEVSLEGYYKKVNNAVDYIEGSDITLNHTIESSLVQGEGLSYGAEFLLRKKGGSFNGWIAYTYSRSLYKFDLDNIDLKINDGEYYPSINDQPHNLSIFLNYHFNERTTLSTNFQYNTGSPITIPTSKFSYDSYLSVLNYSDRNEFRIPDYHRLDLSLTIKDRNFDGRLITGEWVFSIYNLYGRKNAYSIYFDSTGLAYKMSILGSIFPSLSYNFNI